MKIGIWLQRRSDGRWLLIAERRTGNGGTVAVFSDITDLKEREEHSDTESNHSSATPSCGASPSNQVEDELPQARQLAGKRGVLLEPPATEVLR